MKPPSEFVNSDEAAQAYNDDIPGLSISGLAYEIFRAGKIAADNPRGYVHRHNREDRLSAQEWADERIVLCVQRLLELVPGLADVTEPDIYTPAPHGTRSTSWVR